MRCFPDTYRFRHVWRPYQQRVLDTFEHHLRDGHIHIVAAPGAGKTVLGLEAICRLQRPALILAPTSAIRDQWLQRLYDAFLPPDSTHVDWVSTDLDRPAKLTVTTYQGLHAAQRRMGWPALLMALHAVELGTLVLDEAHHLRHQWWQCLLTLKSKLASPKVVALTATPPFDVPQAEWNRYITLCGPLDEEVSVPELVKAGNLCAHQDYIFFSTPAVEEHVALDHFDRAVRTLIDELSLNAELIDLLANHPLVASPDTHRDLLAQRGDYAISIALFLNHCAPERCRALLMCLGLDQLTLPSFDPDWAELLLNGLLFGRDPLVPDAHDVLDRLTRQLRQIGAVEQRQVYLRAPPHLRRLLEGSRNKVHSVAAIIELEARQNPHTLRALILCDHIREADFPRPGEPPPSFSHIGVVPVFEHLRQLHLPDVRLGVLTGSVMILPQAALTELVRFGATFGLDAIRAKPLWQAPAYARLEFAPTAAGALLATMTRLFEHGAINVLVGTAALLGEGWDAPALNTLILATSIRAAMRSNQMRGRAIRAQPDVPHKTANLWHLACLHPRTDRDDPRAPPAGIDLDHLGQRFRSFAGIDVDTLVIETGIERLALDAEQLQTASIDALNARMCRLACDRDAMRKAWMNALQDRSGSPQRMLLETRLPQQRFAIAVSFAHGLRWQRIWLLRWLRAPLLRRRLRQIADALLRALQSASRIRAGAARVDVAIDDQRLRCRLIGASTQEESQFAEALRELFELPQSPRYLLRQRDAIFAVPACLGSKRAQAELLLASFNRHVGRSALIYTRTDAGQRALLHARERWIVGRFDQGCDTRLRWR